MGVSVVAGGRRLRHGHPGSQSNAITFTGGTNVINFGAATSGLTGNVEVTAETLQLNAFSGGTAVANVIMGGAGGLIQNSANTLTLSGSKLTPARRR